MRLPSFTEFHLIRTRWLPVDVSDPCRHWFYRVLRFFFTFFSHFQPDAIKFFFCSMFTEISPSFLEITSTQTLRKEGYRVFFTVFFFSFFGRWRFHHACRFRSIGRAGGGVGVGVDFDAHRIWFSFWFFGFFFWYFTWATIFFWNNWIESGGRGSQWNSVKNKQKNSVNRSSERKNRSNHILWTCEPQFAAKTR